MFDMLTELTLIRLRILLYSLREGGFRELFHLIKHKLQQYFYLGKSLDNYQQYILVHNIHGFIMLVDARDKGIGRELRIYGIHEPILSHLLPLFVNTGDIILDVGANIGYYTLLFSRYVGPNGLVIAVEPEPRNFKLLQINLALNKITNVHLLQMAISDKEGTATLFISQYSNWHSLRNNTLLTTQTVEVTTTTIDTLVENLNVPIKLIRMDIEGFEYEALLGAQKTLSDIKPYLIIEIHPWSFKNIKRLKQMFANLVDLGYENQFLILRGDDYPWSNRSRIWQCSLKHVMENNVLLKGPESFVILLKPK